MSNKNKTRKKKLFVTVGTTNFPKLVDLFTTKALVDTLIELEYHHVQLQTGRDFNMPEIDPQLQNVEVTRESELIVVNIGTKLTLKYGSYFEDFESEILKADLVVSHGGAGTCLDVLRRNKKLIVVINEALMDNHQVELAETLQNKGYLFHCTCESLNNALKKDLSNLKPYPKPNKKLFANYIDKCMGFVD